MTAVLSVLPIALFTTGDTTAEYAFYNLGSMIPLMMFANNLAGALLASLAAGVMYKD